MCLFPSASLRSIGSYVATLSGCLLRSTRFVNGVTWVLTEVLMVSTFAGIALQLSEDPITAEGVYKKALSLCPPEQSHTIYSNLGNLYRQQRRYSEAHTAYAKALELCPEYAPACNNLGLLYITEDRFDEALSSFDRALAADKELDAAKSNRMKAAALAQIRKSSDRVQPNSTFTNSEPSQGPSSHVPEVVPAQGASPIPVPGVESTEKGLEKEP